MSERRACCLVGLSRDEWRHPPCVDERTARLIARICEVAHQRRRFGYRRIHDMVRSGFPGINHKKVYRLYREQHLLVRKRSTKRLRGERQPLLAATRLNDVWSMDFVSDALASGRRLKCLSVADDFRHECVDIAVDLSMPGSYVTRSSGSEPGVAWVPKAIVEVLDFKGDGTLTTPVLTVANPFADSGLIVHPPSGGAPGVYSINDDCSGTVTFSDANTVTFNIYVEFPKGDTIWMIQTNPSNNVFQGSAKRMR